jgi:hypothetical protein
MTKEPPLISRTSINNSMSKQSMMILTERWAAIPLLAFQHMKDKIIQ